MLDVSTVSGRIYYLINHFRLNKNSFSVKLGLSSNNIIGRIVNDPDRAPSFDLLNKIALNFPTIDMNWLITGEGKMIKQKDPDYTKLGTIKYFRADKPTLFTQAIEGSLEPDSALNVFGMEECAFAFDVFGESMAPKYMPGDIIICSENKDKSIIFGETYLIIGSDFIAIRYIRNIDDDNDLIVGSENLGGDNYYIPLGDIHYILAIKGLIKRIQY